MKKIFDMILMHEGFLRYAKNTSWMLIEQFLRIISGLIVGIWLARYLGPEQFGVFSYAVAFSAIFGGVAKLGLDSIVVRDLTLNPEKRDLYLGTAFWLKLFGALLSMAIIILLICFIENDFQTKFLVVIISFGFFFQCFEVVDFYFQAKVLARINAICKIIQLLISLVIKVFLIFYEAELFYFAILITFDLFTLAISYWVAYKIKEKNGFLYCFDLKTAFLFMRESWPLIFSSFLVVVYMRVDQIMLKELASDHDVGIYSAAVRLSEAFYFLPIIIVSSIFPAVINAKKISLIIYEKRMGMLYSFLIWLAIIIAIFFNFISGWLVDFLYGYDYSEVKSILVINVWTSIFVFLGICFSNYLVLENLSKLNLYRSILGVVLNIALNFWLIPIYAGLGAAIATLISQAVANIGLDMLNEKLHKQLRIKLIAVFMPWKHFL